jgi:hypothetical protein
LLHTEKQKLLSEKKSPWKCFFYSDEGKHAFVVGELDRLNIPCRQTENGFESQEIFVEQIRKIEKSYSPKSNSFREQLREILDKVIMQSKTYEEVLTRLEQSGCKVKCGKYLAVRPKAANNFIRTKSLGENYSEQAIRNRLAHKAKFESDTDKQIQAATPDTLEFMTQKTIRHYTIVFAANVLPMRKVRKSKPFAWENCAELDRLAELNRKINAGATIASLRSDFVSAEKSVIEHTDTLARMKQSRHIYSSSIPEIETALAGERQRLKEISDTLTLAEKVMGGTYVQSLVNEEKQRLQSEFIPNGLKSADCDNSRLEELSYKVATGRKM